MSACYLDKAPRRSAKLAVERFSQEAIVKFQTSDPVERIVYEHQLDTFAKLCKAMGWKDILIRIKDGIRTGSNTRYYSSDNV